MVQGQTVSCGNEMGRMPGITPMQERLESLRSGISSGVLASLLWGALQIPLLGGVQGARFSPLVLLLTVGIAGFSGFLFGVTYRYIIRRDQNPHLKSGAVGAFALVRGLSQVEPLLLTQRWWGALLLVGQNFLLFFLLRLSLDWAIDRGLIQRFPMMVPVCSTHSTVLQKVGASVEAPTDEA